MPTPLPLSAPEQAAHHCAKHGAHSIAACCTDGTVIPSTPVSNSGPSNGHVLDHAPANRADTSHTCMMVYRYCRCYAARSGLRLAIRPDAVTSNSNAADMCTACCTTLRQAVLLLAKKLWVACVARHVDLKQPQLVAPPALTLSCHWPTTQAYATTCCACRACSARLASTRLAVARSSSPSARKVSQVLRT